MFTVQYEVLRCLPLAFQHLTIAPPCNNDSTTLISYSTHSLSMYQVKGKQSWKSTNFHYYKYYCTYILSSSGCHKHAQTHMCTQTFICIHLKGRWPESGEAAVISKTFGMARFYGEKLHRGRFYDRPERDYVIQYAFKSRWKWVGLLWLGLQ